MNRINGQTNERISVNLSNQNYQFDSFVSGSKWQENKESKLQLADWTPMLTSKGFDHMIMDWLEVVTSGKLNNKVVERNLASHQLAEAVCQKVLSQKA